LAASEKDHSRGVAETGAAAVAGAAGLPQRDLFREPLTVHAEDVEAEPQRFGRGRPLNSRNRTNTELSRLVMHIAGDPLLAKARVAAMSLEDIRSMLGCNRKEAYAVRDKALDDLLPYIHSRMPQAVQVSTKVTPLSFTVPMDEGTAVVGPDAVAVLFAVGRDRAAAEGFDLASLPPLADEEESDGDSDG
jgi:hypothetical protein